MENCSEVGSAMVNRVTLGRTERCGHQRQSPAPAAIARANITARICHCRVVFERAVSVLAAAFPGGSLIPGFGSFTPAEIAALHASALAITSTGAINRYPRRD